MLYGEWHRSDERLGDEAPRLRLLPVPRPLLELHLLPRRARRATSSSSSTTAGSAAPRARTRSSAALARLADGEHGRPPAAQRQRSTTACSRRRAAGASRSSTTTANPIPSTTRRDDIWELSRRALPREPDPVAREGAHASSACARTTSASTSTASRSFELGHGGRRDREPEGEPGPRARGPTTELYLSGGLGFHSNDARGVVDPVDEADPLVRTTGAEVGVRSVAGSPGLQQHDRALVARHRLRARSSSATPATTEASRPSRRYGVELANYYTVNEWLTLDLDVSLSQARFRDSDPAGDEIPGSVESVVAAGVTVRRLGTASSARCACATSARAR